MHAFLQSKAGKQLAALVCGAAVFWIIGYVWRSSIFHGLRNISDRAVDLAFLNLIVVGAVSSIYSLLRILDLRREMQRQEELARRAHWIATHDHLTRLPNRYALEKFEVGKSIDADEDGPSTATVFSLDLDGFKKVNDLVGHQGGDRLLQEVSKRLSQLADPASVFSLGGDEFLVIAKGLAAQKDENFAKLLIQAISRPIQVGTISCQVDASVGYARWPEQGIALEDVCHRSDIALYQAKGIGASSALQFSEEMQRKVTDRARLEGELRKAIAECGIRSFYQPLIDLRTGEVCGFEALARWTLDDGEQISPQHFIPIAENTGMMTELFQQLLRMACEDAKLWPEHISLSFNVSAIQMDDRLLATRILKILSSVGFAPTRLEVEITENALIRDPNLAASVIDDLHHAGIQIALDDFGTGYSSLAQLARYRFDKIKIDKSFVDPARISDERHEKILQALLRMSRGLDVKTTVEGIENHTQLAYFLREGCDIGQGYLFGKAMPASDVIPYLRNRKSVLKPQAFQVS